MILLNNNQKHQMFIQRNTLKNNTQITVLFKSYFIHFWRKNQDITLSMYEKPRQHYFYQCMKNQDSITLSMYDV
jgi:hypothetical protein